VSSVLITGTSKGIGYETALSFARPGQGVGAAPSVHKPDMSVWTGSVFE
jgi:NAD(P)-dependent dehydrogenase (short-subunit alcohol dehydrogenase family)